MRQREFPRNFRDSHVFGIHPYFASQGFAGPSCQYSNAVTCSGFGTVSSTGVCTCTSRNRPPSRLLRFNSRLCFAGSCTAQNCYTGANCNQCATNCESPNHQANCLRRPISADSGVLCSFRQITVIRLARSARARTTAIATVCAPTRSSPDAHSVLRRHLQLWRDVQLQHRCAYSPPPPPMLQCVTSSSGFAV